MRELNRVVKFTASAAVAGAMVLSGGATAVAAPTGTVAAASSVTYVAGATSFSSSVPAPAQAITKDNVNAGGVRSTQAVPAIIVRTAVKAGLEVLKRTNVRWYNAILSKVKQGKAVFVNWWNNSVPNSVKGVFGGWGANEIYDVVSWIFGF